MLTLISLSLFWYLSSPLSWRMKLWKYILLLYIVNINCTCLLSATPHRQVRLWVSGLQYKALQLQLWQFFWRHCLNFLACPDHCHLGAHGILWFPFRKHRNSEDLVKLSQALQPNQKSCYSHESSLTLLWNDFLVRSPLACNYNQIMDRKTFCAFKSIVIIFSNPLSFKYSMRCYSPWTQRN